MPEAVKVWETVPKDKKVCQKLKKWAKLGDGAKEMTKYWGERVPKFVKVCQNLWKFAKSWES